MWHDMSDAIENMINAVEHVANKTGGGVMVKISRRLRASVGMDAINGDSFERSVCAKQMTEAANYIDSLERERDALREALGGLLQECERSFDWQYDPEFTSAYNKAWELAKGATQ